MPEKITMTGLRGIKVTDTKIVKLDHESKTILYRGYDLKDLTEKSCFEEVAYLLIYGYLPAARQLREFQVQICKNKIYSGSEECKTIDLILRNIVPGAHPMDILKLIVAFYGANADKNQKTEKSAVELLAKMSSALGWLSYSFFLSPFFDISFSEWLLKSINLRKITPLMRKAFDVALMLCAEHELAASTFNSRVTASTLSDYYSCVLSAIGALKGPLHGGANEAVMRMLMNIDDPKKAETWIKNALLNKQKIMGFGHPVYKRGDPRSPIIESYAKKLSEEANDWKWYEMSKIIEEILLKEKGLYSNLDFYSATVYALLGVPIKLFTPIFAVSRLTGWTAHIMEQRENNKIIRPGTEYAGPEKREYLGIEKRHW